MKICNQLCDLHSEQLRKTDLFGGKPYSFVITQEAKVRCGIQTLEIGGRRLQIQVLNCDRHATQVFYFGRLKPTETDISQ